MEEKIQNGFSEQNFSCILPIDYTKNLNITKNSTDIEPLLNVIKAESKYEKEHNVLTDSVNINHSYSENFI